MSCFLLFLQKESGRHRPYTVEAIIKSPDRQTLTFLTPKLDKDNLPLLIFVNKGIEIATQSLTLEIIADVCGPKIAKLATFIVSATCTCANRTEARTKSGPSFAKESE